jgi:hypothetical protein
MVKQRTGFPTLKIALYLIACTVIGVFVFFRCTRDNPYDPNAKNHVSGTPPEATFLTATATGFIKDVIQIPVECLDTQALGGRTPEVKKLYFYLSGDSVQITDSMTVSVFGRDTVTFTKTFQTPKDTFIYVRAKDNDTEFSPAAGMRLIISEGKPKIAGNPVVTPSGSVLTGDSVTVTVSATDTNGTVSRYIWIVNNGTPDTTTDSTLRVAFGAAGQQIILVKALDNDSVASSADTVRIAVNVRIDSLPPELQFMSPPTPHNGDTVYSSTITVAVQTRDPSGILFLYINGVMAAKVGDNAYPLWQIWQRDVVLFEGANKISIWSLDNSTRYNQRADSITVVYKKPDVTPPAIVFYSPQPNDTIRDTLSPKPVTVVVNVSDQSGVAWVRCNGNAMSNSSGSSYTASVTLQEGSDTLIITTEDAKGNDAADTLTVTHMVFRDVNPPAIRIFSPTPNKRIEATNVSVVVYAFDTTGSIRSGIASVTINGLPATYGSGHYTKNIPLTHGYDTIRVVATDSSANQAKDSVMVINNTPPQFVPDSSVKDTSLISGSSAAIPFCTADSDGDAVVFAFITAPGNVSTIPQIDTAGAGASGCAAVTNYSPDILMGAVDTFSVKVTDRLGASDTLRIRVFITQPGATKPYFTTDPTTIPGTVYAGVAYAVQLAAEDPNNLTLIYSLGNPPTPAGVSIDAGTGEVTWTPAAADTGTDSIVAFVSNGTERDTLGWGVTVVMPNLPPVLAPVRDTAITEGRNLRITLTASDPNGDSLIYSFGGAYPLGASLDSISGVFSWTPGYKQAGVYPTVLKVTEKNRSPALSDSASITITVKDTNNPPVLVNPGSKTVNEDKMLSIVLAATDINGDVLRYSMSGAPAGAYLDSVSGRFTWQPTQQQGGRTYSVTFYATDNGVPVMRDTESTTIRVIDPTVPVFDPLPDLDTAVVGFPYLISVHASDADSDNVAYRKLSGPDSLSVDEKYGIVSWRPSYADLNYVVNVAVIAEDHAGNRDTLSWHILVLRWPRVFWSPGTNDTGFSVIEVKDAGDGGVYTLCGSLRMDSVSTVGFLMKTDSSGNPVVFRTYPGTAGHVSLYSIQQTPDDGFIMCGTDSSAGVTKLHLIKTDPAGNMQWSSGFVDSKGIVPSAKGACVYKTSDNGYIACGAAIRRGAILPTVANIEAYMVKTDAAGRFMWDKIFLNGTRSSVVYSVQQTLQDGGYILCGEIQASGGTSTGTDVYLIKTRSGGDTLWTKTYNRGPRDVGTSVLDLNDGTGRLGYLIGGYSTANNGNITNGMLLRVNGTGDTIASGGGWIRVLSGQSAISSVKQNADGTFIACGSGVGPGGSDALLYRFDGVGRDIWMKFHGGNFADGGFSAVQTRDGGFILAGFYSVLGTTGTDIYLLKTDASGDLAK